MQVSFKLTRTNFDREKYFLMRNSGIIFERLGSYGSCETSGRSGFDEKAVIK